MNLEHITIASEPSPDKDVGNLISNDFNDIILVGLTIILVQ